MVLKKFAFVDVIHFLIMTYTEPYAMEVKNIVLPKLLKPEDLEAEFVDITAAVGAEDADEQALIPDDDGAGGLAGKARPLYE